MKSEANFTLVILSCIFFGAFGVHRFMTGKIGTGILLLISNVFVCAGVWWALIDLVLICTGNFRDKEGLIVSPNN